MVVIIAYRYLSRLRWANCDSRKREKAETIKLQIPKIVGGYLHSKIDELFVAFGLSRVNKSILRIRVFIFLGIFDRIFDGVLSVEQEWEQLDCDRRKIVEARAFFHTSALTPDRK